MSEQPRGNRPNPAPDTQQPRRADSDDDGFDHPPLEDAEQVRSEISHMLGIATVTACVPVSDLARARQFYEEKLGLVPKEEYAGGAGLVYECGQATTFFMYQSAGAGSSR